MNEEIKFEIIALCDVVIVASNKFINKCEIGKARSKETLLDMKIINKQALELKNKLS